MSFLGWEFRRKNPNQGVITPEMHERALETRRLKHQIDQLQKRLEMKADLQSLQGVLDAECGGGTDDPTNQFLMMLAQKLFMGGATPPPPGADPAMSAPSLSPEQVKVVAGEIAKKYPDVVHYVKNVQDADLLAIKAVLSQ